MFAITAAVVVLFLHMSRRRPDRVLTIVCISNALVIWVLFTLAVIISDPATAPSLRRVGLASLSSWLLDLGLLWCLFLLYVIFKAVDASALE